MMVLSLCDITDVFGESFTAQSLTFDVQESSRDNHMVGTIEKNLDRIGEIMKKSKVCFVAGFPPCTDLAVSGAAHFKKKRNIDPMFQWKALELFKLCETIAKMSGAPYFIENPVSVVSTMYRKPDHIFHPWEYGGYLPEDDVNPISEIIAARDAYPKKTCLWVGNGFVMPPRKPVEVRPGYSDQHKKLGGKSLRTKNIRSATPRGFSLAVAEMIEG